MNVWMFWKNLLPEKERFYCQLNMEDITDADCAQCERVGNNVEIKNIGECHDLYV